MKGFIIFENFNKLIECKEILDGDYTLIVSDYPNGEFSGVINRVTGATCNKDDTYDFETGALISLMKLCGRDKVIKACDELYRDDNYKNTLQEMTENCEKLMEENEKLQHDYNLCLNSENALKCTVDLLNKSIAKLNKAIYGYKNDLYKVAKRCRELETKEDILNKQEETINKREEEMSTYFGGRGNGKQYKALVDLFKKIPKETIQAAYVVAYKENLIWCTSQPSIRDQLDSLLEESKYATPTVDSLIEESRAFTRKCVDEWLYKPPTKREEMWEKIFKLHKENDVIIEAKREDVTTFLHEIETKFPEITWASDVKIFETKYTIKDVYFELKTCDIIYFRLSRETKLSYSNDPHIYQYRELKHIDYLPPMRWDLFKKGRIVVKVNHHNYEDFYNKCEVEIGRKPHYSCKGTFTVYYSKGTFHTRPYDEKIPYKHKVVNWEDVR